MSEFVYGDNLNFHIEVNRRPRVLVVDDGGAHEVHILELSTECYVGDSNFDLNLGQIGFDEDRRCLTCRNSEIPYDKVRFILKVR